ncbi:MAG: alkaline phosphatase D family protein [Pirellulales bacterium]
MAVARAGRFGAARRNVSSGDYPFKLGVASGDPSPDGFVIWTRLAPKPLEGGGMLTENVEVRWQVADDEKFAKIVAEGKAVATPELAHAVHVEVPGLEPNRWYFYRFEGAKELSPIGRARTAPRPENQPERLRFAFASCQHYESGLFTAYKHMAEEDLDLVAHLGDYIYEYPGKENQVRKHVGPLLDLLVDYRNRHAQYKTDEHLQAMHAKCPWIVTWDDHEFANNCAGLISEKPEETTAMYTRRRVNAYRAYYEHMPLRTRQIPNGPSMRLYRNVSFGRLAEFAVLDTRQYRTDQPCGDGNKPPCAEALSKRGTLLGKTQEEWLYKTLDRSEAKWNVLTQQVMMARADRTVGDIKAYSMDQWPGYEANRLRMLEYFAENPEQNNVVITGDIHCNWVNDLQVNCADEKSPVVATEFVGTSISSSGDGSEKRKDTDQMLTENPFVKWFNAERGYVSCELTPKQFSSFYRTLPFVTKPGAPLVTRKAFVVEAGKPGAEEV